MADIALVTAEWTGSFVLDADPPGSHLICATAAGSYRIACPPEAGEQVTAPGALHLIADPAAPLTFRLLGHTRVCAVDVAPETLRRHAERLLDIDLRGTWRPRVLAPTDRRAGDLARLILGIADGSDASDTLAAHHLMRPLVAETLLTAVLLTTDHPWREKISRSLPSPRPRNIQQAADAIHSYPAHPWTTAELADMVRLSPRALQQGFRTHFLTTPTAYLRRIRLTHVHRELRTADPTLFTVEMIARRWGFHHMPRFAAYYRSQFGTQPHLTLADRPRG
ncbi:helix-turn-helix transcriptional regulator [Kitasatospora sp. MMS16-BH015]|uniref:helix-turn-helix transcriptional regulator n=1 Tax=Kitasatospora sp. MMS16-BH015 TaxID=2018025 RepID=UPI0020C327BF|nr:helix-turn-helix transcriptional regulator [Kitasatospora sp. MMS16-BH015]